MDPATNRTVELGNEEMRKLRLHSAVCALRIAHYESHVSRTGEGGLSLIATLWILTILSVLATQLLYSIRLEQRAQANFTERTKFYYAAKAGFEKSIAMLRGDTTPYDALGENWSQEMVEQIEDGTRVGNVLTYRVLITDEESKVNLNTADANVIRGLLGLVGYEELETAEQPTLADTIVEGRPYRTVRDLARLEGMTQEILYGQQHLSQGWSSEYQDQDLAEGKNMNGLIDFATIYSIDKNTDGNGQPRTNVNSADAQQITQIQGSNNQPVFSQGEAESLTHQRSFKGVSDLIDAQAVSDQIFDNIRDRITVEDNDDANDENNQGQVNINTVDAGILESLDGIDQGIAERIINHRDNEGAFDNVDELREVTLITTDEFKSIVDRITTSDDATLSGLINVNTTSKEVLQLLPGMDENKAQAIIERREATPEGGQQSQALVQNEVTGNPFTNIAQLLDVEGIDVDTFRQIADLITYRSHGFLIESSSVDSRGKTLASCVGAIDRSGQQVAIKYWKQD